MYVDDIETYSFTKYQKRSRVLIVRSYFLVELFIIVDQNSS